MFRAAVTSILCVFFVLDIPNEIKAESGESKEQMPEMACHCHGIREQATDQLEQKESTTHANARSAADSKVSASKTRSRAGRKPGGKKLVQKANMTSIYRKLHNRNFSLL